MNEAKIIDFVSKPTIKAHLNQNSEKLEYPDWRRLSDIITVQSHSWIDNRRSAELLGSSLRMIFSVHYYFL